MHDSRSPVISGPGCLTPFFPVRVLATSDILRCSWNSQSSIHSLDGFPEEKPLPLALVASSPGIYILSVGVCAHTLA